MKICEFIKEPTKDGINLLNTKVDNLFDDLLNNKIDFNNYDEIK